MGRTEVLKVSTKTKGGASHSGAPVGRRLAAKDIGAFAIEEIIRANHKGRPKQKVKIK